MRKSNLAVMTVFILLGISAAQAWDPNKPFIYEMRIAFETDNWINMYSTATVLSKSDNTVAFRVVANSTVTPTYQLVITTQGNVGIGTDSPSEKLYITQSASGQYLKTVLENGNSAADSSTAFSVYDAKAYGGVVTQLGAFGTNYNNSLFTGFGYLGSSKLSLVANGNNSGIIKFMTVSGGDYLERMRINNDGSVGIGTTNPDNPLTIGDGTGHEIIHMNSGGAANDLGFRFSQAGSVKWIVGMLNNVQDTAFSFLPAGGSEAVTILTNGKVGIGTTGPAHLLQLSGGAYCDGTGGWVSGSDRAYKKDIDYDFQYGLKEIEKLKPVYYVHKQDKENRKQIGFIAQDVQKVVPEAVGGSEGSLGLSYERLTAVLVKAMQEQQRQIDELKAENKRFKIRLEAREQNDGGNK